MHLRRSARIRNSKQEESASEEEEEDEELVTVYFDYRLIEPAQNLQLEVSRSPRRLVVSKTFIPPEPLLHELKLLIHRNMGELFAQQFAVETVQLCETDSSGTMLEVDLMDDDCFMISPIEDKTRFLVLLCRNQHP